MCSLNHRSPGALPPFRAFALTARGRLATLPGVSLPSVACPGLQANPPSSCLGRPSAFLLPAELSPHSTVNKYNRISIHLRLHGRQKLYESLTVRATGNSVRATEITIWATEVTIWATEVTIWATEITVWATEITVWATEISVWATEKSVARTEEHIWAQKRARDGALSSCKAKIQHNRAKCKSPLFAIFRQEIGFLNKNTAPPWVVNAFFAASSAALRRSVRPGVSGSWRRSAGRRR